MHMKLSILQVDGKCPSCHLPTHSYNRVTLYNVTSSTDCPLALASTPHGPTYTRARSHAFRSHADSRMHRGFKSHVEPKGQARGHLHNSALSLPQASAHVAHVTHVSLNSEHTISATHTVTRGCDLHGQSLPLSRAWPQFMSIHVMQLLCHVPGSPDSPAPEQAAEPGSWCA